ncbi:ABC multidrug transporter [Thozetella sp. PMI_491]|nr:ABC multidrug transporter [Thozetella sp. PMI_491]
MTYHSARVLFQLLALTLAALDSLQTSQSSWVEVALIGYALILSAGAFTTSNAVTKRLLNWHSAACFLLELGIATSQVAPGFLFTSSRSPAGIKTILKCSALFLVLLSSFTAPRTWTPAPVSLELAQREDAAPSPEQTCSYFSYFVSYHWLTPIVMKGSKRRLSLDDALPLPGYDEPLLWRERILEARKRFKSTLPTLLYALRETIGGMIFFATTTALVEFIAPFSLYQLLNYLQDPTEAKIQPWVWPALMFLGPMLRSVSYQQYLFTSTRLIVRTKLCLVQELYAKAGRVYGSDVIHGKSKQDVEEEDNTKASARAGDDSNGHKAENITNLIAYDVDAIANSRDFILVCTATPIEITAGMIFLYMLFGKCAFIALAVLLCSFPIAALLSRRMSRLQREVMKRTDRRVSIISEYLHSIRTIKYLAWEDIMAENINVARRSEETSTWRRNLAAVAVMSMGDFIPLFCLFTLFVTYALVLGQPLTAARAFTAVSIIETLRLQFVWMANATRFLSQALIAFGRIDRYMLGEPEVIRHEKRGPAFHNATFRRALNKDSFRLYVDGEFVTGALNVISGQSGSGKSSLLLSLLGETVLESGSASCPDDVAYASQVPWLINDTIRANITLHEPFHRQRYDRVVQACALLHDLDKLDKGDLTEVGPGGSNLSGGQRQRIDLARAVYSKSPTLLLDDVFSALDSLTQKHIWEQCFQGSILEGRTIILVTQMQAATDAAELVMELSFGNIVATRRGSGARHNNRTELPQSTINQIPPRTVANSRNVDVASQMEKDIEHKISQETAGQKRSPRLLFYQYMLLFGGHGRAMLAIVLVLLAQLTFFSIPLWLSVWVGAASQNDAKTVGLYTAVYGAILTSFAIFSALSQTYFQLSAWKAAHHMHEKLVSAMMRVSAHWYDNNSPGRVVNRFSRDIFSLDSILVDYLRITLDNGLRFLLRITAIGSIMPIFALPAAFICAIAFVCAEMYTRTQLSVKALASAAQSPIFSYFDESITGQVAIRARRGMQVLFADGLARRMRVYARAAETQYNLNRWICVRADASAAFIALATGILALSVRSDIPAGLVGFSLTNAIGLGQTILNLVRNMNEMEVELNCFYRVREYASLPPEEEPADEGPEAGVTVPENWPSEGKIEFRNVTARYELDGPEILKEVSFTISPGERVAVVGRTGSGKSTLALSLIAFTHITSGSIIINGVDITNIPKALLRKRLTVIPQEPVLFGGDVRFNLDPSQTSDWRQLAEAIDACGVMELMTGPGMNVLEGQSDSSGASTPSVDGLCLDSVVAPRGSNFSVGQRQVLSLARATVRRSQVVILDEATASVDHKSDAAIQSVLRSAFQKKTILAIVHRLSTIMDYDRIIVMESGRIREMGSPLGLHRKKGAFALMLKKSIQQGKGGEWTPEKLQALGIDEGNED